MAQKLNITDKVVSNWETGRSLPDTSMILPLADALNISVEELFKGVNSANNLRGIENNNLKVKYKNLTIFSLVYLAICLIIIISSIMLYGSGHGEIYYTHKKISQSLIIIAVIAVLIEIAIILIKRNQLILGSSNYLKLDKNYINIVLCSFFIAIAIIDILAYSKGGSLNSSSFRLIGMFLVIDTIVCGIPLLINNIRKK